jgi:hypothetical protein
MSFPPLRLLAAGCTTMALSLLSVSAGAATRPVSFQQNGTGACQITLSVYESVVRRRPLAIQNEGSTPAFVTCSPVSLQGAGANDVEGYTVRVVNRGSSLVNVSCTAVIGSDGVASPAPVYSVKSANVGGGSSAIIAWRTLDTTGYSTAVPFNFQCNLQPGIGISIIEINQNLDIGT